MAKAQALDKVVQCRLVQQDPLLELVYPQVRLCRTLQDQAVYRVRTVQRPQGQLYCLLELTQRGLRLGY